jgi:hypothetical protein
MLMLLYFTLAIAGGFFAFQASQTEGLWYCFFKTYSWAFACVTTIIFVDYYYCFSLQLFGYRLQKSFVAPWVSCSLGEFWGKRWCG